MSTTNTNKKNFLEIFKPGWVKKIIRMIGTYWTKDWCIQNNAMVIQKKIYAGYFGNRIRFLNPLYKKVRVFTHTCDGEVS